MCTADMKNLKCTGDSICSFGPLSIQEIVFVTPPSWKERVPVSTTSSVMSFESAEAVKTALILWFVLI
jgi:hypothetical protein